MLPTPTASPYGRNRSRSPGARNRPSLPALARAHPDLGDTDGPYGTAMLLWSTVLGRPAPPTTDRDGLLSPAFVAWLMGLPPAWIDTVPGLPRRARLRALGNSVVPLQATTALRLLLIRAHTQPEPGRHEHPDPAPASRA